MKTLKPEVFIILFIGVLIFIIDLAIPPGCAVALLYLIPLQIIIRQNFDNPLYFALAFVLFTIADTLISYSADYDKIPHFNMQM